MTRGNGSGPKHDSDKAKKSSSRLHDKIMGGHDVGSRKAHPPLRTGTTDL